MAGKLNLEMILRLVNQASPGLRDVQGDLGQLEERSERASRRLGGVMKLVSGAAVGAAAATGGAVISAASMEEAWSEANKTLELGDEALGGLQDQVNDLAVDLSVGQRGLVDILATAGQLGVRGSDDLLAFTEDAAKMAQTFDVSEAAAAQMMGEWRAQTGATQDGIRLLADQINFLGNTTAASSDKIARYTSEVIGIADEAGLAEEETLALGAAMISMGRAPEVAATGMRATLRTMTRSIEDMSSTQMGVLEKVDLAGRWSDIQKQMQTDATGAMLEVTKALESIPVEQRVSAATTLFGEEATRAMGPLLMSAEDLQEAVDRIPDITGAAGSMQAEFAGISDDVADNARRLKYLLAGRTNEYGSTFLDPINSALKGTLDVLQQAELGVPILDQLEARVPMLAGLGDTIDAIGAALSLAWDALSDWASDITLPTLDLSGLLDPLNRLAERIDPAALRAWRQSIVGFLADIPAPDLSGLLDMHNALLGLYGSAVELGGTSLLSFYEGFFSGLAPYLDGIWDQLGPTMGRIGEMFDSVVGIITNVANLLTSASDNADGLSTIAGVGDVVGNLVGAVGVVGAGALQTTAATLQWLLDLLEALTSGDFTEVLEPFQAQIEWLNSLSIDMLVPDVSPYEVLNFFTALFTFDWADLIPILGLDDLLPDFSVSDIVAEIKSWFDFSWADVLPKWSWREIIGGPPTVATFSSSQADAVDGYYKDMGLDQAGSGSASDQSMGGYMDLVPARDAGGPVLPGRLYRINERGEEYFEPSVAGTVHPTSYDATQGAGASTGTVVNATINVTAAPGQDEAAIARRVMAELRRLRRQDNGLDDGGLYA